MTSSSLVRRLALTVPLLALLAPAAGAVEELDRIVLRVNDQIATLHDYRTRLEQRVYQIQRADLEPSVRQQLAADAPKDVMQELLEELLIVSRARQLGLEPTQQELAESIDQAKRSFGIETDQQFREALTQSGLTETSFREQMKRNIVTRLVMGREVQPRIEIADEELRAFYREHEDRFQVPERLKLQGVVVLDTSPLDAAERARLATEIRNRVAAGEAFAEVATSYSAQELTTDLIGLGWVTLADLDDALAQAVSGLEVGDVSEPTAGRGGLHVLELLDREDARVVPFEEVSDDIEGQLRAGRFQEELDAYMDERLEAAYIVSAPPAEAADFLVQGPRIDDDPLAALIGGPFVRQGAAPEAAQSPQPDVPKGDG